MKEFVVKEDKLAYFTGIFSIVVCITVLLLAIVDNKGHGPSIWFCILFFGIFAAAGLCFVMSGKNRRLEVADRRLCYFNLLNRKTEFSVEEIGYVKAVVTSGKFTLYNKTGGGLCTVEGNMSNIAQLLIYLMDNEIKIEVKGEGKAKEKESSLQDILMQKIIPLEEMGDISDRIYQETKEMTDGWLCKNNKLGAEAQYGFAEYHTESLDSEAEIQTEEARCVVTCLQDIPKDYLCTLELYIRKDGKYIRNKKGGLIMLIIPVMYMRESFAPDKEHVLVYNSIYRKELEEQLARLERYLPSHKFIKEELQLPHQLKNSISYNWKGCNYQLKGGV